MKIIKILAVVLFASSIFIACAGGGTKKTDETATTTTSDAATEKPEVVAEKFINAVMDLNFTEAKKYASKATTAMLDMAESSLATAPAEEIEAQKQEAKNNKIEVIGSEIAPDGNTAIVKIKATSVIDGTFQEDKIDLIKEDGAWKINFK